MSKTNAPAVPAKQELISVQLLKPHTHNGADKVPGDTIKVTAPERDFLRAAGVINPETAAADAAAE